MIKCQYADTNEKIQNYFYAEREMNATNDFYDWFNKKGMNERDNK